MQPVNETELNEKIKQKQFSRVYLVCGDESYLKQVYCKRICDAAGEVIPDFNFIKCDGKTLTMQQLQDEVYQMPVMADTRCVLVVDYDAAERRESDAEVLKGILSDVPETTVIVFMQQTVNFDVNKPLAKWNSFIKLVEKHGEVLAFTKKSPAELKKYIIAYCKRKSISIDSYTAKYLADFTGGDLMTIRCEADKLCAYVTNGFITKEDIDTVCHRTPENNKYALSNAIMNTNTSNALKILNELIDSRMEYTEIFGVISSCILDLYKVKIGFAAGLNAKEIAKELGFGERRVFVVENNERAAKHISNEAMRQCLDILADADEAIKTSSADKRFLLERTVISLTSTLWTNKTL